MNANKNCSLYFFAIILFLLSFYYYVFKHQENFSTVETTCLSSGDEKMCYTFEEKDKPVCCPENCRIAQPLPEVPSGIPPLYQLPMECKGVDQILNTQPQPLDQLNTQPQPLDQLNRQSAPRPLKKRCPTSAKTIPPTLKPLFKTEMPPPVSTNKTLCPAGMRNAIEESPMAEESNVYRISDNTGIFNLNAVYDNGCYQIMMMSLSCTTPINDCLFRFTPVQNNLYLISPARALSAWLTWQEDEQVVVKNKTDKRSFFRLKAIEEKFYLQSADGRKCLYLKDRDIWTKLAKKSRSPISFPVYMVDQTGQDDNSDCQLLLLTAIS